MVQQQMESAAPGPLDDRAAGRPTPRPAPGRRLPAWPGGWAGWTAVIFALLAGLHAISLLRLPTPFIDEAWYASHALGVLQTGRPLGPLHGLYATIDGAWAYFPFVGLLPEALAFKLFGVSLLSARTVALAFGLLLLLSVFLIARALYGRPVGLLAVVLCGLSGPFFLSSHLARPDVIVAAAGYGAIALYLTGGGSTSVVKAALAGLAVGLAFDLHPNASVFGPTLVALFLVDHGLMTFRRRTFWAFVASCGAALLLYGALHIAPNPRVFFGMTDFAFGDAKTPPITSLPALLTSVSWSLDLLWTSQEARSLVALPALLALGWRRSPADRRLLTILAVMLIQLIAIVPYKPAYYAIIFSPAYDLAVAAFVAMLLGLNWRGSRLVRISAMAVIGLLATSVAMQFAWVGRHETDEHQALVQGIRAVAPAGSTVMGEPVYWFGMQDYAYVGLDQVGLHRRLHPGLTIDEIMAVYRPDYLIVDWFVAKHVKDSPEEIQVASKTSFMPKAEFDEFLRKRTTPVATLTDRIRGTVQVLRVDWAPER
jgi:4-amino-4-deoxy-L-arabinose transferase-like glycosyltransferase